LRKGNSLACTIGYKRGLDVSDEDTQKLIHYLLENGAEAGCPELEQGCSGYHKRPTALDVAIRFKKDDLVHVFLAHGAKFCLKSLQAAVDGKNESIVKRIIASGADINEGGNT
jgi:hypothetical protein